MIFGDPTRIGFFTTASYLAVAGVCFAWRARTRIPAFFGAVAALMFALGFNKEADLQGPLLAFGRAFAESTLPGAPRPVLRGVLVLGLVVGLGAVGLALARLARAAPRDAGLALAGLGATAVFVVARATSFVNVRAVHTFFRIHPDAAPWLELPALGLVALGARWAVRRADAHRDATPFSNTDANTDAEPRRAAGSTRRETP